MTITATLARSGQPLTLSADGTYYLDVDSALNVLGQFTTFYAVGAGGNNFGSGTLTLYATPDGSETYKVALLGGVLTTDGTINMLLKSKGYILVLSGSTAPTIKIWCM